MLKNLVESTFQRASVAADYDELTVSVGKLRAQVNDLRHVMRDMHQELEGLRAELRELEGLRAEVAALKAGGVVVQAPKPAPVASQPAPAASQPAPAPAAPVAQAAAPAGAVEAGIEEAVEVDEPAPVTLQSIAAAIAAAESAPPPVEQIEHGLRFGADGVAYWGPIDNPSARAKAAGKTLIIDQPECISCGTCVEQTDAVFVLPDDSKAVARVQEGPMDAIQDAIDACPVTCIHWTDDPNKFPPLNDETGRKLAS